MSEHPEDPETVSDEAEPVDPDVLAEEQAVAAAAEAGAIGGPAPDDALDPAEQPVIEGGGGVAEGFELAEEQLVRSAEDPAASPTEAAFTPEQETDRSTAVYGESDEIKPTGAAPAPGESEGHVG